jgi:phosphoglycolate phosphatase
MEKVVKKYFVFDLDDTLVDGRQFCGETIARAVTQMHPDVDFNLVVHLHESIRGMTIVDLYKVIIKELAIDADIDQLLELDKKIQLENINKMKVFDGVTNIFEYLKSKDKKLYICTNRYKELMLPILESNNIAHYFDKIVSCADEGFKKPNPKCLHDIIRETGGDPAEFIYFGDSEIDSQFANNAGIEFIIFDQYLNNKNLFNKLINMFLD